MFKNRNSFLFQKPQKRKNSSTRQTYPYQHSHTVSYIPVHLPLWWCSPLSTQRQQQPLGLHSKNLTHPQFHRTTTSWTLKPFCSKRPSQKICPTRSIHIRISLFLLFRQSQQSLLQSSFRHALGIQRHHFLSPF